MSKLEENIVRKLEHAELPYSDKLWGNISQELNIPKKSYLDRFWILGLFIMCGSMAYFISQMPVWNKNKADLLANSEITASPINQNKEEATKEPPLTAINSKVLEKNTSLSNVIESKEHSATSELDDSSNDKTLASNASTSSSMIPSVSNGNIKSTNQVTPSFTSSFSQDTNNLNKSSGSNFAKASTQNGTSAHLKKDQLVSELGENNIKVAHFEALKNNTFTLNSIQTPYSIHTSNLSSNFVNDIPNHESKSKNYIRFSHKTFKHTNRFESNRDDQSRYVNLRNSTEKERISFSDELVIGRIFSQWLFAEIGIKYEQLNDLFTLKDNPDLIETEPGNTQLIETEAKNKITRWSAPINIGLNIPINTRLSISPIVGIDANFATSYSGQIFNETEKISSYRAIQNSEQSILKDVFHTLRYGLRLNHSFTDRLTLQIGIGRTHSLGTLTTGDYPLKHKIHSTAVDIGSSYNF